MKVQLRDVAKGARNAALPPTSVEFSSGKATLARCETEQRPTVLGLIASGRMRPDAGTVTIDGVTDNALIRARVALIDAPDVSDPAGDVTLAGVVAEELMFAGTASHPRAVARTLASLGSSDWARYAIATVPPTVRIRVLAELALLRDGVEGLVITSPDRHGGDPNEWWLIARELADRGYAVLVIAGDASAAAIAAGTLLERLDAGPTQPGPEWAEDDPGRDDTDEAVDALRTLAMASQERDDTGAAADADATQGVKDPDPGLADTDDTLEDHDAPTPSEQDDETRKDRS